MNFKIPRFMCRLPPGKLEDYTAQQGVSRLGHKEVPISRRGAGVDWVEDNRPVHNHLPLHVVQAPEEDIAWIISHGIFASLFARF